MITTKIFNSSLIIGILFLIILLSTTPSSGDTINGFSGSISSNKIKQGETLTFSGSISSVEIRSLRLFSMNISFEKIQPSSQDMDLLNISRLYGDSGIPLKYNSTFTDVIKSKISYDIAEYNVSIYFNYGEGGDTNENWNITYALTNQIVEITGTTESLRYARWFAIGLGTITGIFIIIMLYNKIMKR